MSQGWPHLAPALPKRLTSESTFKKLDEDWPIGLRNSSTLGVFGVVLAIGRSFDRLGGIGLVGLAG